MIRLGRARIDTELSLGFTLIEVLAAVVILSLFVTSLLTLMGQMFIQLRQSDEKEQAIILARGELGQMAVAGAVATASGPVPSPQVVDGVQYQVTPSIVTSSPPAPAWAQGMVYAEVRVTWNASINGQPQMQSISLNQVFPN